MNCLEWFGVGILSGVLGVALLLFGCSYYVVTHMTKYGPRMMKVMMKRGKPGRK